MPTYEYACRACGTHIEVFQRISDEPLSVCGNCGGPLRKVFHPAGILLKGSGFYKTDNRQTSSSESKETASAGAGKDSAGKDSAGKDSSAKKTGDTKSGSQSGSQEKTA